MRAWRNLPAARWAKHSATRETPNSTYCAEFANAITAERRSIELNREPPIRVVHYLDLLAHQATGQRRRVQQQHHPVVVQGQVARDRALPPPSQDLVQVIGLCQRSMQGKGL